MGKKISPRRPKETDGKLRNAPKRVSFALALMDEGRRYGYIARAIQETFGVVKSTAELDIARAYDELEHEMQKDLPQMCARLSARLWRTIGQAAEDRDHRGVVAGAGAMMDLHGLAAAKRIKVEGSTSEEDRALVAALRLTPAARKQRAEELAAEILAARGGAVEATGRVRVTETTTTTVEDLPDLPDVVVARPVKKEQ